MNSPLAHNMKLIFNFEIENSLNFELENSFHFKWYKITFFIKHYWTWDGYVFILSSTQCKLSQNLALRRMGK